MKVDGTHPNRCALFTFLQKITLYINVMNNYRVTFTFICLLALGFASCSKNDSEPLTGQPGQPSRITYNNETIYFSYQDNQLYRITEKEGAGIVTEFTYEGDELTSVSSQVTNPMIADGSSFTGFRQEGENKIAVHSTAEPSSQYYEREIELNDHVLPVKMTETGTYDYIVPEEGSKAEWIKIQEGQYYTHFSWDASTGNLLKKETFLAKTSELIASYTYKYDNAPGVVSKTGCPAWFYAYWGGGMHSAVGTTYHMIFSNYANNLIEATIDDYANDRHGTYTYTYTYNPEGYPVSIAIQSSGQDFATIGIYY
jgi:hypothetical protein